MLKRTGCSSKAQRSLKFAWPSRFFLACNDAEQKKKPHTATACLGVNSSLLYFFSFCCFVVKQILSLQFLLTLNLEDEDLESFTIKPVTPSALVGQWDDEDVERPGEIKDSWEDEDAAAEEKPKAETQKNFAKTSKKKQSGKQKQRKEADEIAAQPAQPLTYEEKKALQDKVEKSDFAHAVDLFDGVDADNESLFGEASAAPKAVDIEFQPTTPADFKKFGTLLANKVTPFKVSLSFPPTYCI